MKTVQQMLDLKPTTLCPALYKWSIKAAAMLRQQAEQIESLKAECETRKAYGDEQTEFAIKNANERDALKALADNPRNTPFGKKAEKLADDWLAANSPGGWIDDLRKERDGLLQAISDRDAILRQYSAAHDAKVSKEFEAWYAENAFDYASNPIGSRTCHLQWKSWQAATSHQEAKVKVLVDALEGVAAMARCGQLDKFIGEPWLNSVHQALAATKEQA